MHPESFDRFDLKILECLQKQARMSHVELAEEVHLSPSQCLRRLKRLEENAVIRGYHARLEPAKLGYDVIAMVSVSLNKHGENPAQEFHRKINDIEEIVECWMVTGDADYILRVIAEDLKSFSEFLMHRLLRLPEVAAVRSTILMQEMKSSKGLPLPTAIERKLSTK